MLVYLRMIIFFVGVFQQVKKSESTDHNKSILHLKVTTEGSHQNSSSEKKTQEIIICIDEDAQGKSDVIIRAVQIKLWADKDHLDLGFEVEVRLC